jgi:hypothetical protein
MNKLLLLLLLLSTLMCCFSSTPMIRADAFQFNLPHTPQRIQSLVSPLFMVASPALRLPRFPALSFPLLKKKNEPRVSTQPKIIWETTILQQRHERTSPSWSRVQSSWQRKNHKLAPPDRGLFLRPRPSMDQFHQQLFEDADINGDGFISIPEAYEFVLQMYISLNHHAPVMPPSRDKVAELFLDFDSNRQDRGLNQSEFIQLVQHFSQRAFSTVAAARWVTVVGAPLLTEGVLRVMLPLLHGKSDMAMMKVVHAILPQCVTSITFLRSMLLVFFATTLADIVLATVNWILDLTTPAATGTIGTTDSTTSSSDDPSNSTTTAMKPSAWIFWLFSHLRGLLIGSIIARVVGYNRRAGSSATTNK